MTLEAVLARLTRSPDIEAAELRAWDAADRYLLDVAAGHLNRTVVVVDDSHGALSLGARTLGASTVRVHQDSLVAQRAREANALRLGIGSIDHFPLEQVMIRDARLALVRLPRSLDRLDAVARSLAARMHPDAVLIAGNMLKHMTPAQNDVLRTSFERVDVSLARGKARLITARRPRPVEPARPQRHYDDALGLNAVSLPGVFAGATVDIGTRALLEAAAELPRYRFAIDLACGSGVVAAWLARREPTARVIAADVSEIAVRSTTLTAEANDVVVEALHDDGLSTQLAASADLVMLNPPFHVGAAVHTGMATRLFGHAARVLRFGGELWCVWNSHLQYRASLERLVGPTRQVHRTSKFTVTASRRT